MGKSINPMCFSFQTGAGAVSGSAPGFIVLMSLRPAIPWRVGLHQSPPPLYQPVSFSTSQLKLSTHLLRRVATFSTGRMGNFQPVLTGMPLLRFP
jgi:hypothetical protein